VISGQQVVLVRHAHAEWPAYTGRDFDRPLTPRGLGDARTMAAAIRDAGHRPTLLLTSPAKRTRQTAEIIATTLGIPGAAIREVDALYNASCNTLDVELRQALTAAPAVLLVAHNPGISELARALSGNAAFTGFRPAQWLHIPGNQLFSA
jgi:phosphohistidine phosphatase